MAIRVKGPKLRPTNRWGRSVGLLAVIGSLTLLSSCGNDDAPVDPRVEPGPLADVPAFPYQLEDVPEGELWDTGFGIIDTTSYPQDSAGVILVEQAGSFYYQPVTMANYGLALLDNYVTTQEPAYLRLAVNHADRALHEAMSIDGVTYFPYRFDYKLHGYEHPSDFMKAPWYSGMAQGKLLSLLVRLHKVTGHGRWLAAARAVFPSFLRPRGTGEAFTVELDPLGFYWIAEYPRAVPSQVLNGFIASLRGVYEYQRLTGDEDALMVVRASLTTLRAYLGDFRVAGGVSYYCLDHHSQILSYHAKHVRMIRDLERISGDAYFGRMADLFQADQP